MRLTPRDILTLEVIQGHWWLPSHYIYEFTKHLARNPFYHRRSLKRLVEAGYLERPEALNNPSVKNDFLCYALTRKSEDVLKMMGKRQHYATAPSGGYAHAAMTVAITANIDLAARAAGYRFISQEEILAKAPEKTLSLPTKISHTFKTGTQHSDRPTVPDAIFGIDYGDNNCRFFAVEADRGTEPVKPEHLTRNSILRKVLSYKNILISGTYKKAWGIPNLMPLFVTTAAERVESMLNLTRNIYPNGSHNLLFTHIPGFSHFFRSPPLLPRLWDAAWLRAGKEPFYISKP